MSTVEAPSEIQTLHVRKEIQIAAPIDIVFETVLENQGPFANEPVLGKLVITKPPKLLEITGPMMMSYPVASHVQYRLTEEAGGTKLVLLHQAIGLITQEHLEGVQQGWGDIVAGVKSAAESKRGK